MDVDDQALGPPGTDAMLTLQPPTAPTPTRRPACRPRIVAARAAGIGLLVGALVAPASGAAATLQAWGAAEFRDSIGVQTHFGFTGHAYDAAPTADLAAMLRTLGITHLRDDLCFNTEAACQRVRGRLAAMQDALGPGAPKVDLLAGYARELAAVSDRGTRDADIERALTAASSGPLAGMVSGLEPVNEPDLKNTVGWAGATLADHDTFQRLLAQPRFADLRRIPQLSPAIGHAKNTASLLSAGWNRRAAIGNFHPYPPAWGGPEHALSVDCGAGADALGCAKQLGQAAAPIASESGYSTSGNALSTSWVSEQAQATYLPRLLLENFRSGVARTYLYELVDLKPRGTGAAVDGFGLWRARAAGSQIVPADAKPAALALSRMNATIGDLGAASGAGSLDVTLRSGGRDLGDDAVRRVLLHRADGSYVLALWQPKAVWNNAVFKQADQRVDDLAVEIRLGTGTWTATATRPTNGDAVTGRWQGARSFTASIGADVTLVELRQDGDAPAEPAVGAAGEQPSSAGPTPTTVVAATPAATGTSTYIPATPTGSRRASNATWAAIYDFLMAAIRRDQAKAPQTKAAQAKAARARAARAKATGARSAGAARRR
ncbi:MAG: hypothetical protein PGN13_05315 [Patulibacter minatonensis]